MIYASAPTEKPFAAGEATTMSESRRALEAQFERILGEHGAAVSRLAFSYEAVAGVREELVQEIALAIWQALRPSSATSTFCPGTPSSSMA